MEECYLLCYIQLSYRSRSPQAFKPVISVNAMLHPVLRIMFLAHLSTKCSRWAFVIAHCPSSIVRVSTISLNISSETTWWILTKLHTNDPWVVPYIKVVQTVPVGCISRSRGQKIGFQNAISKIFLSETTRPRAFIFGI